MVTIVHFFFFLHFEDKQNRTGRVPYMESELRKDLPLELTLRFMSASVRQK